MKLSVCIPVYNVAPYVEKCARSLFEQTYGDVEYVFVDDCTPDDSMAIVKRVLQDYPNRADQVKFLRHERNRGVVVARMTALRAATGDLITYCDPDDWVDIGLYAQMVERLQAVDADAVMCPACFEMASGSVIRTCREAFCLTGKEALGQTSRIPGLSSLVLRIARRNLMNPDELECPEGLSVGEDMCLSMQILSRCRLLANVIGEEAYHYRQHAQSLSHGRDAKRIFADHKRIFDTLTRRMPDDCSASIRRYVAKTIIYAGVMAGLLAHREYEEWCRIYKALGGQWDWSDKSLWGQRMMRLVRCNYAVARCAAPFVRGRIRDYL